MLEKLSLSDQEYDNMVKGIAIGVGLGILIGAILENVTFYFALGGVIGIIVSLIYSKYSKLKRKKNIIK